MFTQQGLSLQWDGSRKICTCGLWEGYGKDWLWTPRIAKVMKDSKDTILRYISLLQRAVIPSAFWSTCSVHKPLIAHPHWQPTAHPCCLLTQSLETSFMWNHLPPPLTAGSGVLQVAVYIPCVLHYSWIRTLRYYLFSKYLSNPWHLDWFPRVHRFILIHIHMLSYQWTLQGRKGFGLSFWSNK